MKVIQKLKTPISAQLIPSFKQTERRLLSIFMRVMDIVPEFRGHILESVGYRGGKTSDYKSYMEPSFDILNGPAVRPDGLITCKRGQKEWSALVEAKSEKNKIRPEQIENYASLARLLDVDAVITISNEFAASADDLPYTLQRAKRKSREVFHLSWSGIVSEMTMFLEANNKLNDAETIILNEAIRFFSTKDSGVTAFDQMSPSWKDFVNSANTVIGFNSATQGVADIVRDWHQERRDLAIKLNEQIGGGIAVKFPAKQRSDSAERRKATREQLTNDYKLTALYTFGKTKQTLEVVSDLRACSQTFIFCFQPPEGKKVRAISTWLGKKLANNHTNHLSVRLDWPGREKDSWYKASELITHPERIIAGRNYEPKSISLVSSLQNTKRFKSRTLFIVDLEKGATDMINLLSQMELI